MTIRTVSDDEKKKQFKGFGTKKFNEAMNRLTKRAGITGNKKTFYFGGKRGKDNN